MRRRRFDDVGRADDATRYGGWCRFPDVTDALPVMTLVLGRLVQSTVVLQSFSDRLNYEILKNKISFTKRSVSIRARYIISEGNVNIFPRSLYINVLY